MIPADGTQLNLSGDPYTQLTLSGDAYLHGYAETTPLMIELADAEMRMVNGLHHVSILGLDAR